MTAGNKKQQNRPAKRKLVRWDENLNELLLLTVQSVCNREGVKIPWAEVGKTMSEDISEGAIVQHLAKMRTRRLQSNKPVPPPLRRGGPGPSSASSSLLSSKSFETSPTSSQAPKQEQKNKPNTKTKKRAPIDGIPIKIYSGDDEDWEPSQTKKRGKFKGQTPQKKRKRAVPIDEPIHIKEEEENHVKGEVEDSEDEVPSYSSSSSSNMEILAANAPFLQFLEDEEEIEVSSAPPAVAEEEAADEEPESLVVTLKPGKDKLCKIEYKGTGIYHDRDPERRWHLPTTSLEGEKWGFSKDYFGPVPTGYHDSQNPGLLRGQWPLDVIMRQYDAPQALAWAGETHDPDPRIVHPAKWLDNPDSEPQLRFHRNLSTAEQSNLEARAVDQERFEYKGYENRHRELPTYFDPSWNTAPTLSVQDEDDTTYQMHNFSTGNNVPANQGDILLHSDFNSFGLAHPQLEKGWDKSALIDSKWNDTIDNENVPDGTVPPGKIFDLDQMLSNDTLDEAENLAWWPN
ncbi:hypothetical protein PISL3812_00401 [Talaromyces islandicus]|uniref:Uncharacterized protein n=1 Tax=Talaromyces islandicus TaxID=28573 RepID=A0A0U1LJA4_TALIS|nr:hypothetical protein PISL3812_00401 [Talaromyces islandicus]